MTHDPNHLCPPCHDYRHLCGGGYCTHYELEITRGPVYAKNCAHGTDKTPRHLRDVGPRIVDQRGRALPGHPGLA